MNPDRFYFKFFVNGLARGDMQARGQWYATMRNIGVLTANDILRLEDMNTISAAEGGDLRTMQSGFTTLANIGKEPADA